MKILSFEIIFNGDISLLKENIGKKVKYFYFDKYYTGYLIGVKKNNCLIFSDNTKHRWTISHDMCSAYEKVLLNINNIKTTGWNVDVIDVIKTI